MFEEIIEQANLAWVAYAIALAVIVWQIYDFFHPSKPKPNAQPEIYQRLDESNKDLSNVSGIWGMNVFAYD